MASAPLSPATPRGSWARAVPPLCWDNAQVCQPHGGLAPTRTCGCRCALSGGGGRGQEVVSQDMYEPVEAWLRAEPGEGRDCTWARGPGMWQGLSTWT